MRRIEADGLAPRLRSLGGDVFLATLREAHETYGKVLGITAPNVGAPEVVVPLREPLDTFLVALRDYVLKASALEEPGDEESHALVQTLLAPLLSWEPRRRPRANGSDEASGDDVENDENAGDGGRDERADAGESGA